MEKVKFPTAKNCYGLNEIDSCVTELQEENKKLKQESADFKALLDSAVKELEQLRVENKNLSEEILRFDSVLKDRARLVEENDKLKRSQINISNEEANRKLDGLIKMIRAWDVKGGAK
jgi:myosin heavy subunit